MSDNTAEPDCVSRRSVLAKTSALGATFVVGAGATGSVLADKEDGRFNDSPGRGGQSVLAEDKYREDQEFEFIERSGDNADDVEGAKFECNEGNGESIFLVAWFCEYTDSEEEFVLYTRSNNIDTEKTFRWNPNGGKVCGNGIKKIEDGEFTAEDAVQTGYQAVGKQ